MTGAHVRTGPHTLLRTRGAHLMATHGAQDQQSGRTFWWRRGGGGGWKTKASKASHCGCSPLILLDVRDKKVYLYLDACLAAARVLARHVAGLLAVARAGVTVTDQGARVAAEQRLAAHLPTQRRHCSVA